MNDIPSWLLWVYMKGLMGLHGFSIISKEERHCSEDHYAQRILNLTRRRRGCTRIRGMPTPVPARMSVGLLNGKSGRTSSSPAPIKHSHALST